MLLWSLGFGFWCFARRWLKNWDAVRPCLACCFAPRIVRALPGPCGHPSQPVSGKSPARPVDFAAGASVEPQIPLRRHQANPEMARPARGVFTGAKRHRLPGDLRQSLCGGWQKDVSLLKRLRQSGKQVGYTPCDVSVAMVLTARQSALEVLDSNACFPLVVDLLTADDLAGVLRQQTPVNVARLVTFFGLIPNFEPHTILPRLADVLHPNDCLLLSANLAPGSDYSAGVQR